MNEHKEASSGAKSGSVGGEKNIGNVINANEFNS